MVTRRILKRWRLTLFLDVNRGSNWRLGCLFDLIVIYHPPLRVNRREHLTTCMVGEMDQECSYLSDSTEYEHHEWSIALMQHARQGRRLGVGRGEPANWLETLSFYTRHHHLWDARVSNRSLW